MMMILLFSNVGWCRIVDKLEMLPCPSSQPRHYNRHGHPADPLQYAEVSRGTTSHGPGQGGHEGVVIRRHLPAQCPEPPHHLGGDEVGAWVAGSAIMRPSTLFP
jgi:hypothetical protein